MTTNVSARVGRESASAQTVKRLGSGLPFLVPFAVVAVLFLIVPILYGLWLSFTEQSLMGHGGWVGTANYAEALSDPTMWATLGHTIMFTVMSTVPLVLIALVMALLVYVGIPGQWFWRLAFFAPYLLPVAVVVQIWTWLFNSDVGFVNYWLERMGLDKVGWLTDVDVAMWSMVILTVWWTVGFNFLLYLSSLQAIPDLLYEAAEVDGAGFWRKLWSITLPQLRGTTVLADLLLAPKIQILLAMSQRVSPLDAPIVCLALQRRVHTVAYQPAPLPRREVSHQKTLELPERLNQSPHL